MAMRSPREERGLAGGLPMVIVLKVYSSNLNIHKKPLSIYTNFVYLLNTQDF
jgi:hypothetical protein